MLGPLVWVALASWHCFRPMIDNSGPLTLLSIIGQTSGGVIVLFFTLIFRPFSQPFNLHTHLLLLHFSYYHCFQSCFHVIDLLFDP